MNEDRPYFPNLDGLRFFAFLAVFISHTVIFITNGPTFLAQGDLGVSFFFVLSGFLITYLLFFEQQAKGKIQLKNFYARRILRIWPVYFMVLIVGIIVSCAHVPGLLFSISYAKASLIWFVAFIGNFWLIKYPGTSVILAILWSISVEEQFYVVWPLALKVLKEKFTPYFLMAAILLATIYRYLHATQYGIVSYSTLSSMSDLAMGALLAYVAFYKPMFKEKLASKLSVSFLYGLLVLFLAVKMFVVFLSSALHALYAAIDPVIFSILFAGIIFEQNYSSRSLFKIGNSKTVSYLGKISYGLYAYHMIAIFLAVYLFSLVSFKSSALVMLMSFGLTILIASLSYKYIERKILRLKRWVQ